MKWWSNGVNFEVMFWWTVLTKTTILVIFWTLNMCKTKYQKGFSQIKNLNFLRIGHFTKIGHSVRWVLMILRRFHGKLVFRFYFAFDNSVSRKNSLSIKQTELNFKEEINFTNNSNLELNCLIHFYDFTKKNYKFRLEKKRCELWSFSPKFNYNQNWCLENESWSNDRSGWQKAILTGNTVPYD